MEAEPSSAPIPGSIFAGKYRVERLLGTGGMGCVFAAKHMALDEHVAIKMLLPRLALDPNVVMRFLREGRAAVKIRSEHVGRVFDVGSNDGSPYIVMEYLDGCDLAVLLEREKQLPERVVVDYILQACEALAEAHAMGLVHRDLKPANLFLVRKRDGEPCVKVLDFGISKMTVPHGASEMSMTRTATVMGSPSYMSPEQLKSSKTIDARADIWAIGVVAFELLSGKLPFDAHSLPELGVLVLSGVAPDVRTVAPSISPGVADAVAQCLRTDPEDRFPSVAELAAALAPFGSASAAVSASTIAKVLEHLPRPRGRWPAAPPPPSSSPAALGSTSKTWESGATPSARRRGRGRLGLLFAGLLILGAIVITAIAFRSRATNAATSPQTPSSAPTPTASVSETRASELTPPETTAAPSTTRAILAPSATVPRARATVAKTSVPSPTPSTAASTGFTHDRHD